MPLVAMLAFRYIGAMKNLTEGEKQRFKQRFKKRGQCWLWQGALDRDGYGAIHFRGAPRRVHRVAWFSVNGEIPKGHVINHTCRNRACVNPQHLQCLTVEEHQLKDTTSLPYINSQKSHCPKGHSYDKVVTWGGRTQRICSICTREKQRESKKKRYWEAKLSLSV